MAVWRGCLGKLCSMMICCAVVCVDVQSVASAKPCFMLLLCDASLQMLSFLRCLLLLGAVRSL